MTPDGAVFVVLFAMAATIALVVGRLAVFMYHEHRDNKRYAQYYRARTGALPPYMRK
jgi:hypothetical protein